MEQNTGRKRTRMVRPYPTHTLEDSIGIARAIHEYNAGLPFDRKLLARALGTTPASSSYTMRLNSASKYGITQGGYNDDQISLTARGQAIVAPKDRSELGQSEVEAAMQPDVFGKFYRLLDGKHLPEDTYVQNLLRRDFGIHQELTVECLGIIKANGLYAGIIKESGGSLVVNVPAARQVSATRPETVSPTVAIDSSIMEPTDTKARSTGKVFIGHNNRGERIVNAIQSILETFDIPYAIADGSDEDSGLISPQISAEMRGCTAAILVIEDEGPHLEGSERTPKMNSMIYQLGAASVLYGSRILVLKDRDIELSFNTGGVRCAEFGSNEATNQSIELLKELHLAGVLRVTA